MPPAKITYDLPLAPALSVLQKDGIEYGFIGKLQGLKFQVYAVQHLVKCIDDDDGNGFVWHTAGSGKTLTSLNTLRPDENHVTTSLNFESY